MQLPIFPSQSTPITSELAFQERDGLVWYFNGHFPVFSHPRDDMASFRFYTSQLVAGGSASQGDIARAFGVTLVSVKRACKKLRDEGAQGFFGAARRKEGKKLTAAVLARAQGLLDAGAEVPEAAGQLGVLANTLHKAIRDGRLKKKDLLAG